VAGSVLDPKTGPGTLDLLPFALPPGPCRPPHSLTHEVSAHVARTPRKWTGARNPSGLKRVRSAERRHEILQPRRTAAKSLIKKALVAISVSGDGVDPQSSLSEAMSALDRAAKVGAIHPNAAARRKSRLARKVFAAAGGAQVSAGRVTKTTGTAAAQKQARARIAASKAAKAKGAQTAAGKARAALSKTARAEAAEAQARAASAAAAGAGTKTITKPGAKSTAKTGASRAKAAGSRAAAGKASSTSAKASTEKPAKSAPKATNKKST
jgi:ribosomal protein S20